MSLLVGVVMIRRTTSKSVGLSYGFRSGLEETIGRDLEAAGVKVVYEECKISYTKPARKSTYTPDFELPNGIIVETKGRFVVADRQKHLLVQAQHPHLDIRFVFSNSKQRISKTSTTTYADWCVKNGFKFSDKKVPAEWLEEKRKPSASARSS